VPASTRRALGAVVASLGIILVVVGAWIVVNLGPSGEASFSATSRSPGAIVIPSAVLNAVDVPVHVTATRRDGGPVRLTVAPSSDAREMLATSAVSTVSAVRYPAGTIKLRASGTGALADITRTDVWRVAVKEPGTAVMVVGQARAPETVVVSSGDATALTDVTLTLSWAERAWFFEALAMATLGAVLAAFAMNDLWQGRAVTVHGDVVVAETSEATA
jgi:hypothetical protein